jgi:hypothetical protein
MRSRFALAASVALLVVGAMVLAGKFPHVPDRPAGPTLLAPSAMHEKFNSTLFLEQGKDTTVIKVNVSLEQAAPSAR